MHHGSSIAFKTGNSSRLIQLMSDGCVLRNGEVCFDPGNGHTDSDHKWCENGDCMDLTDIGHQTLRRMKRGGYQCVNQAQNNVISNLIERYDRKANVEQPEDVGRQPHFHAPLQDENGNVFTLTVCATAGAVQHDLPGRICRECRSTYIERSVFITLDQVKKEKERKSAETAAKLRKLGTARTAHQRAERQFKMAFGELEIAREKLTAAEQETLQ